MLRIGKRGLDALGIPRGPDGSRKGKNTGRPLKAQPAPRVCGPAGPETVGGRLPSAPSGHPDADVHIEFVVLVRPRVKARHRSGQGNTYTPRDTEQFERLITAETALAVRASGDMLAYPVCLTIGLMFSGDESLWPVAQADGDLSNIIKAIEDGMNKVAYRDDRLIAEHHTIKICGCVEGIYVSIRAAAASPFSRLVREKIGLPESSKI